MIYSDLELLILLTTSYSQLLRLMIYSALQLSVLMMPSVSCIYVSTVSLKTAKNVKVVWRVKGIMSWSQTKSQISVLDRVWTMARDKEVTPPPAFQHEIKNTTDQSIHPEPIGRLRSNRVNHRVIMYLRTLLRPREQVIFLFLVTFLWIKIC